MMDPYYNGLVMSPVYVPSRMYREQLTMSGAMQDITVEDLTCQDNWEGLVYPRS